VAKVDLARLKTLNPIEDVAREHGITFNERGWGCCPFGDRHTNGDANPSLHLDRKKQRVRCESQNCFNGAVDVVGLVMRMQGLDFKTACQKLEQRAGLSNGNGHTPKAAPGGQRIVATYDYKDETGKQLFQVLRKEPGKGGRDKDFDARRPDDSGGWIWNLEGVQLVPYRLPELLKSDGPVVIVEGEKCVDVLWSMGIPATCNPFGAGKWREEFNAHLKGREVILWPDRDEAGQRHVQQVARSLAPLAASVRVVEPPAELPEKGDVADGVRKLSWSREKVLEILAGAQLWEPTNTDFVSDGPIYTPEDRKQKISLVPRSIGEFFQQAQEVKWRVKDLLPEGAALIVVADAATGKTWMTLELALAVDQGTDFLGQFPTVRGKVLIIDEENADSLLKHRLKKLLRGLGLPEDGSCLEIEILTSQGVNLSDSAYVEALERLLEEKRPDLVIIDALVRVHRGNENDAGEMAQVFAHVKRWMNTYGCSFVFCHHRKKPQEGMNSPAHLFRGSSEIRAFMDSHLDLRPIRGERGLVTVEHAKSRYIEPVPNFNIEIVDLAEGQTVVRYAGEPKTMTQDKLEEAQEFIRSLADDGEWHGREEIIDRGQRADLKRDTLDTARRLLIDSGELMEEKRGKKKGVRHPQFPSDAPDIYIPPEATEDAEALFDLEEVRV